MHPPIPPRPGSRGRPAAQVPVSGQRPARCTWARGRAGRGEVCGLLPCAQSSAPGFRSGRSELPRNGPGNKPGRRSVLSPGFVDRIPFSMGLERHRDRQTQRGTEITMDSESTQGPNDLQPCPDTLRLPQNTGTSLETLRLPSNPGDPQRPEEHPDALQNPQRTPSGSPAESSRWLPEHQGCSAWSFGGPFKVQRAAASTGGGQPVSTQRANRSRVHGSDCAL